jgi:hypothetical protein
VAVPVVVPVVVLAVVEVPVAEVDSVVVVIGLNAPAMIQPIDLRALQMTQHPVQVANAVDGVIILLMVRHQRARNPVRIPTPILTRLLRKSPMRKLSSLLPHQQRVLRRGKGKLPVGLRVEVQLEDGLPKASKVSVAQGRYPMGFIACS